MRQPHFSVQVRAQPIKCMRDARTVERMQDPAGCPPRQRYDDEIATPALPQIQRMPFPDPWHTERIGPVGEQVHEATAGEPEQRSSKGMRVAQGAIGDDKRGGPGKPPMCRCTMRNPKAPRACPPGDFEPIGRRPACNAGRERRKAAGIPRARCTDTGDKRGCDDASRPTGSVMCLIRSHSCMRDRCREQRSAILAEPACRRLRKNVSARCNRSGAYQAASAGCAGTVN